MIRAGWLVFLLCTPFGVSVHTITKNTGRFVTRDVLESTTKPYCQTMSHFSMKTKTRCFLEFSLWSLFSKSDNKDCLISKVRSSENLLCIFFNGFASLLYYIVFCIALTNWVFNQDAFLTWVVGSGVKHQPT